MHRIVPIIMVLLAAGSLYAARGFQTVTEDEMTWNADGTIRAVCHEVNTINGVVGNFWISLAEHPVGQTFRCQGPRLKAVQLGVKSVASGYVGLRYNQLTTPITLHLRDGGPNGKVVAEKTFWPDQIRADMPMQLDLPSDASKLWYLEIRQEGRNCPPDWDSGSFPGNMVNINTYDTYPDGQLHLGGVPADGDLCMRITRSWTAKGERPGKVVFWASRPEERIGLDPTDTAGLMLTDDSAQPVQLEAARGERVSVQMVATPAPDFRIAEATVSVSPFVGPGGTRIAAENIRIEWLRYVMCYWQDSTSGRIIPDPLAPTATAKAASDQPDIALNTTFWVSVKVPRGIPAGIYRSMATMLVNGDLELTRPVELEVFDFDLPHRTHTRSGLFGTGGDGDRDFYLWMVRDIGEFRIATDKMHVTSPLGILRDEMNFSEEAYKIVLGREMQDSLIETGTLLNELGLDVTCVTPWADTYRMFGGEERAREGIIRFWKTYYPILKEHGWVEQAYCRMPDEGTFTDDFLKGQELTKLFRQHAPGVKIMVTDMDTGDVDTLQRIVGIADIWAQSFKNIARPEWIEFFKRRIALGEEVWPYIHYYVMLNTDAAAPRLFFWAIQKHGYHGATLWSAGPRDGIKRSYSWFGLVVKQHEKPGDGDLYWPATEENSSMKTGVWRTARLYRMGDGLEDREYFWTMNDLAQQARQQDRLTAQMSRRIDELNARPADLVHGFVNFTNDMREIDQTRRELAEVIVELEHLLN